jgi:LCP family protein required for cell wall assembly
MTYERRTPPVIPPPPPGEPVFREPVFREGLPGYAQTPDLLNGARERSRRRTRRRTRGGEWAWVVIAATLLVLVIAFSGLFALFLRAEAERPPVMSASAALPTPVDARTALEAAGNLTAGSQITLDDGRSIVLAPWNGASRFTVLVMGLDRRPGETGLSFRTDTMMLISLDPRANTLGILSIPRDLYVDVPGYSQLQRVNSAMVLGEIQQPGTGPTLAMQTVQYNLGIRVHHYVAADFNAVTRIVDLVGGLEIDVPYDIVDYEYPDMNYGYDPLILRAGVQMMDGATALRFARTRHGDNDFERARRQQMVLYALRDRVLDMGMLPQLVVQSPSLLGALQENLYTDLTLDAMIQLALVLKDVPRENIRTGVIDSTYIMDYVTAEGAQVLVPRRAQLSTLLSSVFGANYSE